MEKVMSHRQLAVSCFNNVWDILDKHDRTELEKEMMIHLAHTSFWNWTQVEGHTPTNLSIGYWLLSRVYATIGSGEQALFYANRCIDVSIEGELSPFYIGYGYEAQARSYQLLQKNAEFTHSLNEARSYAERTVDEESKKLIEADLEKLKKIKTT